ncbi:MULTISPECIES: DUF305 domain-containing protein [Bordetella]|uniref:Exported protein n=4 Tax=Bordetella TaxID=517 RepID=K0MB20_BORPB|nr:MULTISPECIES: DUF305 domain-containing protein [Bordetella]KAK67486.1 PF03713 domain protein [Bordetella bronchiseptica 980-2]KDD57324.1 PF03713 domain protein [Bordetella bronchiseptica OSU553]SHP60813.1 Uncharacterized protein conserved in bacteria [Mycobacteroides abscessus subsp. abscessus]AMG90499.1 DUF305 domain-containing protein [Bordetella bronchiseptica]AUL18016.1 DUF305 domain-containing protein [Bordetella bronchiseptica]
MQLLLKGPFHAGAGRSVAALLLCLAGGYASAHGGHHGADPSAPAAGAAKAPPVFVASTAKPFSALMDDAMAVMDEGMLRAPMNGQSNHDFMTMMMPHHQGAVDMAKAVLLYTEDPEVRNLALGIITEQQNEIRVMQAWLDRHAAAAGK